MFSIRPFIYLYIFVILMVRKGMQIYLFLGRFFHMLYSLSVYLFIILRSTTWASLINVYFIIYFQKEGKEDSAIYTKVTFGWQVKCFFFMFNSCAFPVRCSWCFILFLICLRICSVSWSNVASAFLSPSIICILDIAFIRSFLWISRHCS